MAWRAKLSSVQDQPVANDTVNVDVTYYDNATGKEFRKSYNLHASNFPDVQSFKDFVKAELQTLKSFDGLKSTLVGLLNQDI